MNRQPLPRGPLAPVPEKKAPRGGWLVRRFIAPYALLRFVIIAIPVASTFIIVTALLAGVVEAEAWRWGLGAGACLGVPLAVRWRLASALERRGGKQGPGLGLSLLVGNVILTLGLALGFADDVGRALRRHGDWFLGDDRNGFVARKLRASVDLAAGYLEKFDPAPELDPVIVAVAPPPPLPGNPPLPPAPSTVTLWFHPLAGPRREMPGSNGRRFGAARPGKRPAECELGHCGVDLGGTLGQPVFAVFDGVVKRASRDADADARAGIYLEIAHKDGTVVSHYIHLDSIEPGLKEGDHVTGGQIVGRLGRTGVYHSGPHLHFALSLHRGGERTYVDPEPYLAKWKLTEPPAAVAAREAAPAEPPPL